MFLFADYPVNSSYFLSENINHLLGDGQAANASKGAFKETTVRVFTTFGSSYEVEIPAAEGGHGGADPVMLEQLFSPNAPPDPYQRAASHIDGAASILVGISANRSIETKTMVTVSDLFPLPEKASAAG